MAKSDSILPIVVPRRYEPDPAKYDFNQNIKVLNIKMISFKILINTFINFFNIFSITNLLTIKSQSQGVLDLFKRISILPKTYFLLKDLKELKEQKIIHEGMLPKMKNAFDALNQGVSKVAIGKPEMIGGKIKHTSITL